MYALDGYVVARRELERVLGCKDTKTLAQLRPLAEDVVDHEPKAFEDLVMRRTQRAAHEDIVFAFEAMCGALGRRVGEHNHAGTHFQSGVLAGLLAFDKEFKRAGITNIFDELDKTHRRAAGLLLALVNTSGRRPAAAVLSSEMCATARAEIVSGFAKIKPPYRPAVLELYGWFAEVSSTDVLALFYY